MKWIIVKHRFTVRSKEGQIRQKKKNQSESDILLYFTTFITLTLHDTWNQAENGWAIIGRTDRRTEGYTGNYKIIWWVEISTKFQTKLMKIIDK